jgi:hypothetical protein
MHPSTSERGHSLPSDDATATACAVRPCPSSLILGDGGSRGLSGFGRTRPYTLDFGCVVSRPLWPVKFRFSFPVLLRFCFDSDLPRREPKAPHRAKGRSLAQTAQQHPLLPRAFPAGAFYVPG